MTCGIYWFWWSARQTRYHWACSTFRNARFQCTVTGGKLFRLVTGNIALIVVTLGFGASWVYARTARFWTENLFLQGELDPDGISQDTTSATATGEGFADFFGLDMGF